MRVRPTLTDGDASRAKGVTSNARTLTECDVSHRGVDPWRVKDGHRRPAGDQVGLPPFLAPEPSA